MKYRFASNSRAAIGIVIKCVLVIVLLFYMIDSCSAKASIRQLEKRILDEILGHHYDSRIRPSGNNATTKNSADGACIVTVNIFVRSISRIDDVTMEYATQITFREEWNDDRLRFNNKSGIKFLTLTEPEKIWKPDLFFSNEKEGHFHTIIMPNVLLRIHPDGQVLYSIRISLVLFCPMHLKYFPLDMQTCHIKMGSYGYTTEDLIFLWKKANPVQITHPLNLPRFKLIKYKTDYCTSRTNTGEYSCIVVDLIFKREFSYYLILIYVPCCMLVIVSWVSFWIDPNSTAARVLLGVTSLLTMSRQNSGINASLPPVSYTKAVDVWTGCCLTFVFGALIEFAVVNYVSRREAHKKGRRRTATPSAMLQRKRSSARSSSRKKLESGKDSGIESDDLEDVLASRYVKQLGATRLPRDSQDTGFVSGFVSHRASMKDINDPSDTITRGSFSVGIPNQYELGLSSSIAPGLFTSNDFRPLTAETSTGALMLAANSAGAPTSGTQLISRNQVNYGLLGSTSNIGSGFGSRMNGGINGVPNGNMPSYALNKAAAQQLNDPVDVVVNQQKKVNAVKHVRRGNFFVNWLNRFPTRSKRIDVLSRIFFPLLFALFNVFYWVTYLWREELINS